MLPWLFKALFSETFFWGFFIQIVFFRSLFILLSLPQTLLQLQNFLRLHQTEISAQSSLLLMLWGCPTLSRLPQISLKSIEASFKAFEASLVASVALFLKLSIFWGYFIQIVFFRSLFILKYIFKHKHKGPSIATEAKKRCPLKKNILVYKPITWKLRPQILNYDVFPIV